MPKAPEGEHIDIEESTLLPVTPHILLTTPSGPIVAPTNVAIEMYGAQNNKARGLIPGKLCPHCGRKETLIVLRREHGDCQLVRCVQCDEEFDSQQFAG